MDIEWDESPEHVKTPEPGVTAEPSEHKGVEPSVLSKNLEQATVKTL